MTGHPDLVWYVAYGSNLSSARFSCYLQGGRAPGAGRVNPGARDPSPPRQTVGTSLDGTVYFAGRSLTWGGATAFYDRMAPGPSLGRGYLITVHQLADVIAQEVGRSPLADLDRPVPGPGSQVEVGEGRYETLVGCGFRDGWPMVTLTAPWAAGEVEHGAPTLPYLVTLATGLAEAHGFSLVQAAAHLAGLPGVRGAWEPGELAAALGADND